MGFALLGLVAVTAVITWALTVALRPAKPMRTAQRRWVDQAFALLSKLHAGGDIRDVEILSDRSKDAADALLSAYDKEFKK